MIKKIALEILILSIFIGIIIEFFFGHNLGLSSAITSLFLVINLLGLYVLWRVIIFKKSIAQGLLIIILKYPILGYSAVLVIQQNWFNKTGLLIGLFIFVVGTAISSVRINLKNKTSSN